MCRSVDASQHRLNHKSLISLTFISGQTLNAMARIDSQETRKVQLHCQPVSNAIPLLFALTGLRKRQFDDRG
jgi:hypothetical protein